MSELTTFEELKIFFIEKIKNAQPKHKPIVIDIFLKQITKISSEKDVKNEKEFKKIDNIKDILEETKVLIKEQLDKNAPLKIDSQINSIQAKKVDVLINTIKSDSINSLLRSEYTKTNLVEVNKAYKKDFDSIPDTTSEQDDIDALPSDDKSEGITQENLDTLLTGLDLEAAENRLKDEPELEDYDISQADIDALLQDDDDKGDEIIELTERADPEIINEEDAVDEEACLISQDTIDQLLQDAETEEEVLDDDDFFDLNTNENQGINPLELEDETKEDDDDSLISHNEFNQSLLDEEEEGIPLDVDENLLNRLDYEFNDADKLTGETNDGKIKPRVPLDEELEIYGDEEIKDTNLDEVPQDEIDALLQSIDDDEPVTETDVVKEDEKAIIDDELVNEDAINNTVKTIRKLMDEDKHNNNDDNFLGDLLDVDDDLLDIVKLTNETDDDKITLSDIPEDFDPSSLQNHNNHVDNVFEWVNEFNYNIIKEDLENSTVHYENSTIQFSVQQNGSDEHFKLQNDQSENNTEKRKQLETFAELIITRAIDTGKNINISNVKNQELKDIIVDMREELLKQDVFPNLKKGNIIDNSTKEERPKMSFNSSDDYEELKAS